MVPEIASIVEAQLSTLEASQADLHLLLQANGLVLALFTNAFDYRSQNRTKYQLSRAFVQPWTSDPSLLHDLRQLFDTTVNFRTRSQNTKIFEGLSGKNIQQDLTDQLRELANCLFRVYDDRLQFMHRCVFL